MRLGIFAAIALIIVCAGEASAWNGRGHMMIATIAWDHLSPGTRARVSTLIRINPHYGRWTEGVAQDDKDLIAFVKAATWADEIKGEAGYVSSPDGQPSPRGYADRQMHREWHYKDLSFSPDGARVEPAPASNAIAAIERMTNELHEASTLDDVRSYDLVWLLHLVGDVHQPLHATTRYTVALPKGDRGGNELWVCPTTCTSAPKNLHAFWDDLMGPGGDPTDAIKRARKLPPPPAEAVAVMSPDMWLEESLALAKAAAYDQPIGLGAGPYQLTEGYKINAGATAQKQISLAGVRLAQLIELTVGG